MQKLCPSVLAAELLSVPGSMAAPKQPWACCGPWHKLSYSSGSLPRIKIRPQHQILEFAVPKRAKEQLYGSQPVMSDGE